MVRPTGCIVNPDGFDPADIARAGEPGHIAAVDRTPPRLARWAAAAVLASLPCAAYADDAPQPESPLVQGRFATTADHATIAEAACALGRVWHAKGGLHGTFVVLVDTNRCPAPAGTPDAVTLTVRAGDRERGEVPVVVDAETPDGVTTESFRPAVDAAVRELQSRLERLQREKDRGLERERRKAEQRETQRESRDARDAQEAEAGPKLGEHWYGYQTVVADCAGAILLLTGLASGSGAVAWLGYGTYALAPPVIHFAHGRVGIGFADLGLRLGAPVIVGVGGALIGATGASGSSGSSSTNGAAAGLVLGVLLGYGTAVTIDAAVFAYEKVPPPKESGALRRTAPWFTLRPDMSLAPGRSTVGVAGTF